MRQINIAEIGSDTREHRELSDLTFEAELEEQAETNSLCVEGITTLTIVNRSRNLHSGQSAPLLALADTEDGDVSDEIQTDVSRLDPKPCVVGGQTPYGAGAPPQKPPSSCG